MARAGQLATPVLPAPRPLRPLLRFAKVGDPALATVRRALDGDEAFRARVLATLRIAGVLDELDEASRLFLERPEGWEATLDGLGRAAIQDGELAATAHAEDAATKRLEVVRQALDRAELALATATADVVALRAEVAEERRARRNADSDLGRLRKRVAELEAVPPPVGLPPDEGVAAAVAAGRADLQAALAAAEQRAERAEAAARAASTAVGPAPEPPPGSDGPPPAGAGPVVDHVGAAGAVGAAVAAVGALAEALGRAAEALGIDRAPEVAWPPSGTVPSGGPGGGGGPGRGGRRSTDGPDRPRRTASPLPPAVFDDTAAAADHLLRLAGVVVLVDGYNVTLATKGDLDLGAQRRWLLDAAAGVARRTGATFEVVFDGDAAARPAESRRAGVQVRFTAAGEEADDVLLALASTTPLVRPVVVVSDDRRVRDGARRLGANTLGVAQLVDALRR